MKIAPNTLTKSGLARARLAGGYTMGEVLLAFGVMGLMFAGLIYGYVQTNRVSEWSSMSMAAQAFAAQGAEQARASDWRPRDWPPTNGLGTMDELTNGSVIVTNDYMDIPVQGAPTNASALVWVTNVVTVTDVSQNPKLRQIRSECRWTFPLTGLPQTNT
jgi:Tfp pilus assembly protein PilV